MFLSFSERTRDHSIEKRGFTQCTKLESSEPVLMFLQMF